MNSLPIIFIVASVFALGFTLVASAQTPVDRNDIRFAYAESVIRNADGQLVSYIENHRMAIISTIHLNQILDYEITLGNSEILATEIDGVMHEWIRMEKPNYFENATVRSTTQLGSLFDGEQAVAISFTHDAYVIDRGDELTVLWTIARPFG